MRSMKLSQGYYTAAIDYPRVVPAVDKAKSSPWRHEMILLLHITYITHPLLKRQFASGQAKEISLRIEDKVRSEASVCMSLIELCQ